MPYLIGTDEAGYAPNLGPLVISATVWELNDPAGSADLYETLADVVTAAPPTCEEDVRVALADSKMLYTPRQGLSLLERGVLAALGAMDHWADDWRELWGILAPD